MTELNLDRRQALVDLLSLPDAPDLHRGHRLTHEGRSDRYSLVPYLAASFVQAKLVEMGERQQWLDERQSDVARETRVS